MSGLQLPRRSRFRSVIGLGCACVLGLLIVASASLPAAAARHPAHRIRHAAFADPGVVGESIVIDAATGRVISEANADVTTYPASLTKMMTLYLTFQALNAGRLRIDQYLPVSAEAAAQAPTKLGLMAGDTVQVRDLILGIVTRSANDAAVVLAEGLGGSVPAFADRMNETARQLGMTRTIFRNPSGLPDPDQQTTARDMARLALALIHDFPREYRYFATTEFEFRGATIHGHDRLLNWYPGADGIKTGYIRTSGFNLATSAMRDGHRLVGVVMGGHSASARDREMGRLLDEAFAGIGAGPVIAQPAAQPAPAIAAVKAEPPPVVAVAKPQPAAPKPEPLPAATAASPQPAPALAAAADPSAAAARPGRLAKLAAHLSPVTHAEAAPIADERPAAGERWGVQLGAFSAEAAAEKIAHEAAGLRLAKNKTVQIVHPEKGGKDRLYRARLLNFTAKEAREVCAELKRKHIECTILRPGTKVASR